MMDVSMMLIGLQRETLALTYLGMYNRTISPPVPPTPHSSQVPLLYSTVRTFALQANINNGLDTPNWRSFVHEVPETERGGDLSARSTKLLVTWYSECSANDRSRCNMTIPRGLVHVDRHG